MRLRTLPFIALSISMRASLLGVSGLLASALAQAPSPFACNFLLNASAYGSSSCGLLPFPDDFWLTTTWNETAVPGMTFTNDSLPRDNSGSPIRPVYGGWASLQGFSPLPQITAVFPDLSLEASGFPRLWNLTSSLLNAASVPSLLLDTETLEPVAHWAELDESSGGADAGPQALLIWPSASLHYSRRYLVALRFLRDSTGALIPRPSGFDALFTGQPSDNPALEASRPRYKELFTLLDKFQSANPKERGEWLGDGLTLVWSFTTNSRDDIAGRFVSMRDDALKRTKGGKSLQYEIVRVTESPSSDCARMIQGFFLAPWYLNQQGPSASVRLVLDPPSTGLPVFQGFAPVNFTVRIPSSLRDSSLAFDQDSTGNGTAQTGRLLNYGHGLFGHCTCNTDNGNCYTGELEAGYLNHEARIMNSTLYCTNEIGMAQEDEITAAVVIGADLSDFAYLPDRLHQGILNEVLLGRLMTVSAFVNDTAVQFPLYPNLPAGPSNPNVSVLPAGPLPYPAHPAPSEDLKTPRYYGNSNGGIYGSVLLAVSPDVRYGTSGVAGGPYSLLLPRSQDFAVLFDLIKARYSSPVDRISILSIVGERWSRLEPSSYARFISLEPLPNTPAHTILIQSGLGDAQVSIFAVQTLARSVGSLDPKTGGAVATFEGNPGEGNQTLASLGFAVMPANTTISGVGHNAVLTVSFAQTPASANPFFNLPANGTTDTHSLTRLAPQVQAQHRQFLLTGVIADPCPSAGCVNLPTPSQGNDDD